jgi:flagellar hook protein FlgE
MSIFGSMKTAVSGMNAQATRLSTVADNIANVNTTGYKSASVSFSSLMLPSTGGNYNSGGVESKVGYSIAESGSYTATTSQFDLSIKGDGFFIVNAPDGSTMLTRAGDFLPDSNGNLVNAAGFMLMGYSYDAGSPSVVVNGFDGLVPVNVKPTGLVAKASTSGDFSGNLNSNQTVAPTGTATLPSNNDPTSTTADTIKTSIVGYDRLGNTVMYDMYFTKTAKADAGAAPPVEDTWEVAVFRHDDAAKSGTTSFPYGSPPVAVSSLSFDANGKQTSTGTVTFADPETGGSIAMDVSGMTQLASKFSGTGKTDGQGAGSIKGVTIDKDGIVSAIYGDGDPRPMYRIPLATVASPDLLSVESGNVYRANSQSGVTVTGFPQSNGLGSVQSGSLEGSNVDLADQLTVMIESQRSYTANSKVFQTGSDILDVLVNLKR